MDAIEIKPANAKALQAIRAQVEQLSSQYQGAVAALAIANDVPANWQWDIERAAFVAPPPTPAPNGNGHAPPNEEHST